MKKVIGIYSATRSDYGLLSPIIKAIKKHPKLDYQLFVTGSHLSYSYGNTISEIEEDGFKVSCQFSLPEIDTKTNINNCMSKISQELNKSLELLNPDIFLVLGDRFETFAAAQVAFFLNIPVAHVHGGDITKGGCIDDSIRHSITKLAHLHFAACDNSAERIKKLGEESWRIHNCGAPGIDNCKNLSNINENTIMRKFNLNKNLPIILFTQHSITTETNNVIEQVKPSLEALKELNYQTIITYPNLDPGGEKIIELLTKYKTTPNFQIHESLGYKNYIGLMKTCSVVVGNTSSGILETPFFKKPFVNIGTRQQGRLSSTNTINVDYNKQQIINAIEKAIYDEEFLRLNVKNCSNIYGDGNAGEKIASILSETSINKELLQKKISY